MRMLGAAARRPVCVFCGPTAGDFIDKRGQRSREKQNLQRWVNEYEDPADVLDRACPKGGPDCDCARYREGEF
ncbi:hypothetical protein ACFWU5_16310 [Nocardia sp. NPDC058640]|uniref:hypothetical protein n=1 Tax=Nocardia sp. NPDC058640 TaxID=3346571 RepID=UPI0036530EA6